jgi:NitT/TauT family transport system substrate-binding protein
VKRATFAAATAAMLVSARAASAQTPAVIRVATGGKESDAQAYYAQELGYFARAGLNVEVQTMQSGSAIAAGVAAGALQIGVASVLVVATAHQRGLPFVYIAPAAQYSSAAPPSVLVVAANSPLRSAQELNGRTIGVLGLRGIDQITAQAWIDQNGGDSSTVRFAEVIRSEMPPALERGTLDAAQLAEPVLSARTARFGSWVARTRASVRTT